MPYVRMHKEYSPKCALPVPYQYVRTSMLIHDLLHYTYVGTVQTYEKNVNAVGHANISFVMMMLHESLDPKC